MEHHISIAGKVAECMNKNIKDLKIITPETKVTDSKPEVWILSSFTIFILRL